MAGTAYERRIVKHSRSIVGRYLGIKRAKILRSINVTEQEALDGLMETATEAGSVTEEQGYELDLADIIIAGSSAPGGANYAVIEVSETIDDNDVDRAHERAAILARAVSEAGYCRRYRQGRFRRQSPARCPEQRDRHNNGGIANPG